MLRNRSWRACRAATVGRERRKAPTIRPPRTRLREQHHQGRPGAVRGITSAGFAAMGQWVITMRTTGDEGFFFRKPSGGDWQLSLHPSIDYFIINSVSLGAAFGYFIHRRDTAPRSVSLGGRAGFNLNINDNLGFWPTVGVGFTFDSRDHGNDTTTFFGIFAPFLYHLVPHLFVGSARRSRCTRWRRQGLRRRLRSRRLAVTL
jgi:hypothetical protein